MELRKGHMVRNAVFGASTVGSPLTLVPGCVTLAKIWPWLSFLSVNGRMAMHLGRRDETHENKLLCD